MYCVYLTIYRGNKLPPFYIGYSSINKIKAGYINKRMKLEDVPDNSWKLGGIPSLNKACCLCCKKEYDIGNLTKHLIQRNNGDSNDH